MNVLGNILSGNTWSIVLSTFVACSVEMTEVSTIILGVGQTRGWKSTLMGAATGLIVLVVTVFVVGTQIAHIPIHWLRLIVGALLLSFGLNWLRKAVISNASSKQEKEENKNKKSSKQTRFGIEDWYGFTLALKGTLLEGLEIVFIIITFGAASGNMLMSVIGGAAAIVIVGLIGIFIKDTLAHLPNKILKYIVGVLLTTFGTYWATEGAGVHWPGKNLSLLGLVIFFFIISAGYIQLLKFGFLQKSNISR